MRKSLLLFVVASFSACLLSACSDAPSTSDVQKALTESLRQEIQTQIDSMMAMTGNREHAKNMIASMGMPTDLETIEVHDVSMGEMTKGENDTHSGRVDFTFTAGKGRAKRTIKRSVHATFSRESGAWRVVTLRRL